MTDNQKLEDHLLNALECLRLHQKNKIKNGLLQTEVYIEQALFLVSPESFDVINNNGVKEIKLKHAPKTHPKI